MRVLAGFAAVGAMMLWPAVAEAQSDIRTQRVQFPAGQTGTVISDSVTGQEVVDYVLSASAGQTMHVVLYPESSSANFNIIPPNPEFEGQAIFLGSNEGTEFSAVLTESGDYRIRVYLLGNAEDTGLTVGFDLEVSMTGAVATNPAPAQPNLDHYDANGIMPCSFGAPNYNLTCPWRVTRHADGGATIYIDDPDGTMRVLEFANGDFQSHQAVIETGRDQDFWLVNVNDYEFYRFADILIEGEETETPAGVAAAAAGAATDEVRMVDVQFAAGATSATLNGQIVGYGGVEYHLNVTAGQTIHINMTSDNIQNYFNVFAPGDDTAIFIGSTSGTSFVGVANVSGVYRVSVYMMRAAARRDEVANFTITFEVDALAGAVVAPPAPGADYADGLTGGPDYWAVTGLNAEGSLNLHTGPSVDDRVTAHFINGTILRNLGCLESEGRVWCHVQWHQNSDAMGWVAAEYLSESGPPAATQNRPTAPTATDFTNVIEGGPDYWAVTGLEPGHSLNMRQAPSTGADEVGHAPVGTVLRNLGCVERPDRVWCHVSWPHNSNLTGWVAAEFLRESGPATTAAATPATLGPESVAQHESTRVGILECTIDAGFGLIIGGRRDVECVFYDVNRTRVIERYEGFLGRLGFDIGFHSRAIMAWFVVAPSFNSYQAGALTGNYVGVGTEAALGVGGGTNILVGGNRDAFNLQPLSNEVELGLNVAVGVERLHIEPTY